MKPDKDSKSLNGKGIEAPAAATANQSSQFEEDIDQSDAEDDTLLRSKLGIEDDETFAAGIFDDESIAVIPASTNSPALLKPTTAAAAAPAASFGLGTGMLGDEKERVKAAQTAALSVTPPSSIAIKSNMAPGDESSLVDNDFEEDDSPSPQSASSTTAAAAGSRNGAQINNRPVANRNTALIPSRSDTKLDTKKTDHKRIAQLALNYDVDSILQRNDITVLLEGAYAHLNQLNMEQVRAELNVFVVMDARRAAHCGAGERKARTELIRSSIEKINKAKASFYLIDDGLHWAAVGLFQDNNSFKLVYFNPFNPSNGGSMGSSREHRCQTTGPTFILELVKNIKKIHAEKFGVEIVKVDLNVNMSLHNSYSVIAALNIAALATYQKINAGVAALNNYAFWLKDLPFIRYLCQQYSGYSSENKPTAKDNFQMYVRALYTFSTTRQTSAILDDNKASILNVVGEMLHFVISLKEETEEKLERFLHYYGVEELSKWDKYKINPIIANMPDYDVGIVFDLIERYQRKNLNKSGQPYSREEIEWAARTVIEKDELASRHFNPNAPANDLHVPNNITSIKRDGILISELVFLDNHTRTLPYLRGGKTWEDIPNFAIITAKNGAGKSQLLKYIHDSLDIGARRENDNVLYVDVKKDLFSSYGSSGYGDVGILNNDKEYEVRINEIFAFFNQNKPKPVNPFALKIIDTIERNLKYKKVDIKGIDKGYIESVMDKTIQFDINHSLRLDQPLSFLTTIFNDYEKQKRGLIDKVVRTFDIMPLYECYCESTPKSDQLDLTNFLKKIAKEVSFREALIEKYVVEKRLPPSHLDTVNKLLIKYGFEFSIHLVTDKRRGNESTFILKNKQNKTIQPYELSSGQSMILCMMSWLYYYQGLTLNNEQVDRQIDNRIKLILLDEPDRHLDPQLAKLFFKIVYEEFVKCQGIQVIMTTHRTDTIALIPPENLITEVTNVVRSNSIVECGLYTIERTRANYVQIVPITKLHAMFRLTRNLRELIDFHLKVHVESVDDAMFYEGAYHSLLEYCNEVRLNKAADDPNKHYWVIEKEHRLLSRRYQLAFHSVSKTKDHDSKGGGGCGAVIAAINREETAYRNLSANGDNKNIPPRWKTTRRLYTAPELYQSYGVLDNDYGRNLKHESNNIAIVKQRHSLDNFLYDPFVFCLVLTEKEIADYISYCVLGIKLKEPKYLQDKECLIKTCLTIKKLLTEENLNGIQAHLEIYFKIILGAMAKLYGYRKIKDAGKSVYERIQKKIGDGSDFCDKEITVIYNAQKNVKVRYPKEFLEVRGHDIEELFFRDDNPFQALDIIVRRVHQEGLKYLPLDLAQLFFDLNVKVRAVVRAVIKPGQAEAAYQPVVARAVAPQSGAPDSDSKDGKSSADDKNSEGKTDSKHATHTATASPAIGLPFPYSSAPPMTAASASYELTMHVTPAAVASYQKGLKTAKQIATDELLAASLQGSTPVGSAVTVKSGNKKNGESKTPPPSQTATGPLTPFPTASASTTTALSSAPSLPTASAAPPKITVAPGAIPAIQAALNPSASGGAVSK